MKNLNNFSLRQVCLFIAGSAIAATSLVSCSKSSSSSNTSPYVMTATKNGSNVSFSGASNVAAVVSGPLLEIVGATYSGSDTTGFIFLVGDYTGPGSYTLDGTTNSAEYISKTGSSATLILATSGTLTITSAATPTMKGTFNFSGAGITGGTVTNGSFVAKF